MNATSTQFTALVLAGSRVDQALGTSTKAGINLRGVPMLRRVVDALRGSSHVGRIVVCGPGHLSQWIGTDVVPTAGSPASSVAGFLETQSSWPILVTTADHPLLTREMIDYFCRETLKNMTDITVGMASRTTIARSYPKTRRTYFRFKDDHWCGCNLFGMNTPNVQNVVRFWQALENHRKRPMKVVRGFGLMNLLGVALGLWTVQEAFARGAARFGMTGRPIPMPWAEAAIDVDTLEDLVLVDSILAAQETLPAAD